MENEKISEPSPGAPSQMQSVHSPINSGGRSAFGLSVGSGVGSSGGGAAGDPQALSKRRVKNTGTRISEHKALHFARKEKRLFFKADPMIPTSFVFLYYTSEKA